MHAVQAAPAPLSVAGLCKCLGDESRLSLLCLMGVDREVCVCDLVAALDAPQSTISRHLAQLRQCGLVVARRQGTWMHYRLNDALPEWALTTIETLMNEAREQLGLQPLQGQCC
jgi:ArsR family transcriptional regulator